MDPAIDQRIDQIEKIIGHLLLQVDLLKEEIKNNKPKYKITTGVDIDALEKFIA